MYPNNTQQENYQWGDTSGNFQLPYSFWSNGFNSLFGDGSMGGGGLGGGGFGGMFGGGGGGGAGASSFFSPAAFAALIGIGKNTEANHPNTVMGNSLLAGLGPSASQVFQDPVGMGLPTLLGAPFLTPFTGSDKAKKTKPEWSGLFGLGF